MIVIGTRLRNLSIEERLSEADEKNDTLLTDLLTQLNKITAVTVGEPKMVASGRREKRC